MVIYCEKATLMNIVALEGHVKNPDIFPGMWSRRRTRPVPTIYRPLVFERVYLPSYKVADTPFHIQGDDTSPMLF